MCGWTMAALGPHSLTCIALWKILVALHSVTLEEWRCIFTRAGMSSSLKPRLLQGEVAVARHLQGRETGQNTQD